MRTPLFALLLSLLVSACKTEDPESERFSPELRARAEATRAQAERLRANALPPGQYRHRDCILDLEGREDKCLSYVSEDFTLGPKACPTVTQLFLGDGGVPLVQIVGLPGRGGGAGGSSGGNWNDDEPWSKWPRVWSAPVDDALSPHRSRPCAPPCATGFDRGRDEVYCACPPAAPGDGG